MFLYKVFGTVLIALLMMSLGFLAFQLYPYSIAQIIAIELANGPEYRRGDEVVFDVTYTKKFNFDSETHRRIECEDGNLITMTSFGTSLPLTDTPITIKSPPMKIPEKASVGECWFVFTEHTFVNPVRTIVEEINSESFIVTE